MAAPGDVIEHPDTHERVTFLETHEQTGGAYVRVRLELAPNGLALPSHVHPRAEERIEVMEGDWVVLLDEIERRLCAGDIAIVPSGHAHRCWTVGDAAGVATVTYRPAHGIAEYLETIFGLAQHGFADPATGLPAQPWLALLLDGCLQTIAHPAEPPLTEQLAALRPIADEAKRQGLAIPYPYPYPYRE